MQCHVVCRVGTNVSKKSATLKLNAVASIMPLLCMFQEKGVTSENACDFISF